MALIYCKNCGKEYSDKSGYCPNCGESTFDNLKMLISCKECGETYDKQFERCPKCGCPTSFNLEGSSSEKEDVHYPDEAIEYQRKGVFLNQKVKNKKNIIIGVAILIIVIAVVIAFIPKDLSSKDIAKLSQSVLILSVYDKEGNVMQTGSGFIAFDDKTIVTNYHVIDQGYKIEAQSEDDVKYQIQGVDYYDAERDIAVLRITNSAKLPVLHIADSASIKEGDEVYAIGSPLGLKNTVSNGIISAVRTEDKMTDIQFTAPISEGSSGGVLLNSRGKVIGITYAAYDEGQNLNLAIPSNDFRSVDLDGKTDALDVVAKLNNPFGNSYCNINAMETRLVENDDFIYESMNQFMNIIAINKATGKETLFDLKGHGLNIYKGVLYLVPPDGNVVSTYDLKTKDKEKNILKNYGSEADVNKIRTLFVSKYGISVISETGLLNCQLLQLDFEGNIVGRMGITGHYAFIEDGVLVTSSESDETLKFIDLVTLKSSIVELPFAPTSVNYYGGRQLYICSDEGYSNLYKYDLDTGDMVEFIKFDGYTYNSFPYKDVIYYKSASGTDKI